MNNITENDIKNAKELLDFIQKSNSPFHACREICNILDDAGFTFIEESQDFNLEKGGKYYTTRNSSSVVAFEIGEKVDDFNYLLTLSHLDSPTFKVKDIPEVKSDNYTTINLEKYGGAILNTWVDRPLSLAGRVMVEENNRIYEKLVNIDEDLLVIPNVAIHLNGRINEEPLDIDRDYFALFASGKRDFVEFLKEYMDIKDGRILGKDLYLVNRTNPQIFGADKEFLSTGKLDNLESSYTTLMGFISSCKSNAIKIYASFDSEEVGSNTMQGAMSTLLKDVLERISMALGKDMKEHKKIIAKSFVVSADNAHAIHPNRPDLYDKENYPEINKGIVLKENASQKYMTSAYSRAIFKSILDKYNIPHQSYANKNSLRGGATLGNLSNMEVSMHGVDIGLSQLAMHSSYETAGTKDIGYMIDGIKHFYESEIIMKNGYIEIR